MTKRESEQELAIPVPDEIMENLRDTLLSNIDKTLEGISVLAPIARSLIEHQWNEGIDKATYSLGWGEPLNANLPIFASVIEQWMNVDYGENMVDIKIRRTGRPGDAPDELVATNNIELRRERLAAGAVEISRPALIIALEYIQESKNQEIDNHNFESAATWRDNQRNVIDALNGLGLAKPEN